MSERPPSLANEVVSVGVTERVQRVGRKSRDAGEERRRLESRPADQPAAGEFAILANAPEASVHSVAMRSGADKD